jgi:hypothetical protein
MEGTALIRWKWCDWLLVRARVKSQNYFTTASLPPISWSRRQAPRDSRASNFIFQLNTCGYSPYVIFSLTKGWVCRLQLLLTLVSAVVLRPESRGTHDQPGGPGTRIYIPQGQGGRVIPQALGLTPGIMSELHLMTVITRISRGLLRWNGGETTSVITILLSELFCGLLL